MSRIACCLLALILLAGCAAPSADAVLLEEPVIVEEDAPISRAPIEPCEGGGDDGIGGTGCRDGDLD